MPRQSPRLGVTAISNNQSCGPSLSPCRGTSDSTSRPAIGSSSASFSGGALKATNSFNQLKVNFMRLEWIPPALRPWHLSTRSVGCNPPKRTLLRQGYGGYPPRIHPRVYTRGFLRRGLIVLRLGTHRFLEHRLLRGIAEFERELRDFAPLGEPDTLVLLHILNDFL